MRQPRAQVACASSGGPERLAWGATQRIWTGADGRVQVKTEPASESRLSRGLWWDGLSQPSGHCFPGGGWLPCPYDCQLLDGTLELPNPVLGKESWKPVSRTLILRPLWPGAPPPARLSPRDRVERRPCSMGVLHPGREGSAKRRRFKFGRSFSVSVLCAVGPPSTRPPAGARILGVAPDGLFLVDPRRPIPRCLFLVLPSK